MYKTKLSILFFSIIGISFFAEGLGFLGGRTVSLYILIVGSLILFFSGLLVQSPPIIFPKRASVLFGCFLFFSLCAAMFSTSFVSAFVGLLLYSAYFLLFLYSYHAKEIIGKGVIIFFFVGGIVLPFYSILGRTMLFPQYPNSFFIPTSGYQLITAFYGVHNNMGDFLSPVLIALVFYFLNSGKMKYLFFTVLLLPFFLFSYSRSAYISFLITASAVIFWLSAKKHMQKTMSFWIVCIVVFIVLCVGALSIKEINQFINPNLRPDILLTKPLDQGRSAYILQAGDAIKEHVWWGVGPYNFISASVKFRKAPDMISDSSSNIFIDVFVENGLFAFISFVGLMLVLLFRGEKNIFFFMWLAMLIDFQTHYTFRLYSMQALFFILAGLMYKESNEYSLK